MDDRTKRVLIANRDKLRTGISAASLLPVLYSRFVIDDEVKHDIQHTEMNTKRTSMQQVRRQGHSRVLIGWLSVGLVLGWCWLTASLHILGALKYRPPRAKGHFGLI